MAISSVLGSSALLPAGLGFRNKIINGDFGINQRGFTSTTTSAAYGFDRWTNFTNGGLTYSAQTFTAGTTLNNNVPKNYASLATSGQSSSSALSVLAQRIEDVRNCAGQQVTVSFWAKAASGTPKVAIEFLQNFGVGGSAEVEFLAGQVTLSTSWARYSITAVAPSINGKTIGTENTHSLGLLLWTSAGSTYNTRSGSIGIQNNTIDFWGVQLEQNLQPTPFEQRPIGVELQLCQRYYFRKKASTTAPYAVFGHAQFGGTSTTARAFVPAPVPMRTLINAIDYGGTLNMNQHYVANYTATSITSNVNSGTHETQPEIGMTLSAAGPAAGTFGAFGAGNDANAYIGFSAEL